MEIEEIIEGNKLIANYMELNTGWSYHESEDKGYGITKYHSSWDWLMTVIEKINGLGKEYNFSIFKTYVALSVEKGGRVFKDFSFAHSENITSTQTSKQAAFKLVVKFVKWQNEKNLAQNLEVTK